jgi:uncharacterized membrane protein YphA (DoxX/SURF4 family)
MAMVAVTAMVLVVTAPRMVLVDTATRMTAYMTVVITAMATWQLHFKSALHPGYHNVLDSESTCISR